MPEDLPLPDEPEIEPVPTEPVLNEPAPAEPAPTEVAPTEPAAPAIDELPPAACAARLAELFPALFTPGAAKPLKLRIQADIQARAPGIFTKKSLSVFLHRHTTSTPYLRAMVASPHRIDLDGAPAGEVADEHRQAATAELERRRTLHDERRAGEREALRKAEDERRKALQAQWPARPAPGAAADGLDASVVPGAPSARDPRDARGERSPAHARPRPPQHPSQRPTQRPPQRPPRDLAPPVAMPAHPSAEPVSPPTADDEGRRERLALLRAYEASTLTRANFCVLKRMTEAQLEEQLAQARLDAPRREPAPQRPAAPTLKPPTAGPLQRRGPRR